MRRPSAVGVTGGGAHEAPAARGAAGSTGGPVTICTGCASARRHLEVAEDLAADRARRSGAAASLPHFSFLGSSSITSMTKRGSSAGANPTKESTPGARE